MSEAMGLMPAQVPMLRDSLLQRSDWQQVADRQRGTVFGRGAGQLLSKQRMDEIMKTFDFMCQMQPGEQSSGLVRHGHSRLATTLQWSSSQCKSVLAAS